MGDRLKGFFILHFVCTLSQISVESLEEEYLVDVRLLWEESDAGDRWKRDVDSGLPDHLSFAVPVQETDMTLRMRRSRLIPTATSHSPLSTIYVEPIYTKASRKASTSTVTGLETATDQSIVPPTPPTKSGSESGERTRETKRNAAVYTDPDKRAALIVKRDYDQYSLEGSFYHAEKEWSIQPLTRIGRSHLISPISVASNDGQAVSDEILIDEPPVEVLNLEDRNRYRLERLGLGQDGDGQQTSERQARGVEGYRRMKRSVTSHTIEIAFIVDYADYEKWVEYKGESNAATEMTLWYTYIAEAIKIRFETIDKSVLDITTVVNFLRILTNETDDDFIEVLINSGTFSGSTGLENFTTWYQDPANNISNADHYMYFTGFDISSASGIAYVGTTCTVYGVSLVENGFTAGTAVIASHELGH
ncbi:A disintegrin and metalloproteinase with thrombospondin motifs 1, partial [Plakobranchus ocellatus]